MNFTFSRSVTNQIEYNMYTLWSEMIEGMKILRFYHRNDLRQWLHRYSEKECWLYILKCFLVLSLSWVGIAAPSLFRRREV